MNTIAWICVGALAGVAIAWVARKWGWKGWIGSVVLLIAYLATVNLIVDMSDHRSDVTIGLGIALFVNALLLWRSSTTKRRRRQVDANP